MSRELIEDFARLTRRLAKHSTCKRRGVAAIILQESNHQVVGWGVNGTRAGCSGVKDNCGCAHSEINTLLNGVERSMTSCLMIVTRAPCVPCATAMVNWKRGRIRTVYILDQSEPGAEGVKVLVNCGMNIVWLDIPDDAELGLRDPNMAPSQPSNAKGIC